MSEIMPSNVLQAGTRPKAPPGLFQADIMFSGNLARENVRVIFGTGQFAPQIDYGSAKRDQLCTGLAVRQAQTGSLKIHVLPSQFQNFIPATLP